jgi:hypothetical protein
VNNLMKYIYTFILIVIAISFPARSQEIFDTKGKEFIVTYMPNYHDSNIDSLFLFITSEEPSSGYIEMRNANNTLVTRYFTISDPSQIFTFGISYNNYEIDGYDQWSDNQDETIARQTFRIYSDKDVTVYGLNKAVKTSDAFLTFPVDVLGKDYFVMTYNSDGIPNSPQSTPSQFAIVATEDGTKVEITPSAPTQRFGMQKQTIDMKNGDVYLVQASVSDNNLYGDLTGTSVKSTKPIAVFAGHKRATIPYDMFGGSPSRDCLVEQLLPVSTWGYNAYIVPFTQGQGETYTTYKDLYRVMAAFDSTKLLINGTETVTLNKGKFLERQITGADVIEADKPILTAQFKKTANTSQMTQYYGDPFMVIIPPKEQFLDNYRIINIRARDLDFIGSPAEAFVDHYISVTLPTDGLQSITLDGIIINSANFKAIGTSNYVYANLKVSAGVHSLFCDKPFGIIIYGFGYANSYGYIGGMGMQPFDSNPPEITENISCYKAEGIISDTARYDKGIKSMELPTAALVNVNANLNQVNNKLFTYSAELIDKYFDGSFRLIAIDSMGLKTDSIIDIPGFTLSADSVSPYNSINTIYDTIDLDIEKCYNVSILNYGKFTQNNIRLKSVNGILYYRAATPFNVNPKEKYNFQVCVGLSKFGHYTDTLIIENDCGERRVVALDIFAGKDDRPPSITETSDSCNLSFRFLVSDSTRFDIGLKSINTVSNENCSVMYNLKSEIKTWVDVSIIDPYQDSYFKIIIEDSLGNKTEFEKEIPGFTVNFYKINDSYNFGNNNIGNRRCDTIMLYNYGKYTITFNEIPLEDNTLFSIPQSQFPVIITPSGYTSLAICYNPYVSDNEADTDRIHLLFNCLVKSLSLSGTPDDLQFKGDSRCGLPVYITTSEVPENYYLEGMIPNPAFETGSLVYGVPHRSNISLDVYDLFGRKALNIYNGISEKGWYKINADISGLTGGTYFVILSSGNSKVSKPFILY